MFIQVNILDIVLSNLNENIIYKVNIHIIKKME